MKKVLFVVLLWILVYFASPWSDGLHFIEKRGTTVINDYLYELPTDWEVWLLSFSGFLYSNADEDFLTGFLSSLENSRTISLQTYELSDSNVPDSGILIYPLNKVSFSGTKYLRCVDGNSQARVVSFAEVTSSGAYAVDDAEDVINDIWNNAGGSSTLESDDFSDELNNIFNP